MVVTAGNPSHSDGGEGSSRATLNDIGRFSSDGEKFPRAIAKVALAQICESAGFHSIQRSALETLADIAIRYLCDVGKNSQLYANLSGRTQSNALDAVAAVEDISGASYSDPHIRASSSVCVKDLIRFVDYGDELPFVKPLPHFPVCKTRKPTPSFAQLGETPPDPHIPPWLPALPDPQTYMATSVENENKRDAHMDNPEQTRERHKVEQSRVSLRFRQCTSWASMPADHSAPLNGNQTAPMGTSPPSASRSTASEQLELGKADSEGVHNKAKSGKRPAVSSQNPFLAPALPEDSKKVSTWFFDDFKPPSPAPSTKKIIAPPLNSALGPIFEAASNNVQDRGMLPSTKYRRPVHMFLGYGKSDLRRKDSKRDRTQMDEDDKDVKKKRAEQNLSQYFNIDVDDDDVH